MIALTEEQRQAVAEGCTPTVVDPATSQEYVLVRAEVYAKLKAIVDGVTKRAGWDDPALDVYESYRKALHPLAT